VHLAVSLGDKAVPWLAQTHLLCYQSRVGPAKWLQPPLTGTIERLAHERVKRCASFPFVQVTEHIENAP